MIVEYTGKYSQKTMPNGDRPYFYNILSEKLEELINLNPHVNEEIENKRERDSKYEEDADQVCKTIPKH